MVLLVGMVLRENRQRRWEDVLPELGGKRPKKGTGAAQSFMKCAERMGVLPLSRQPGN